MFGTDFEDDHLGILQSIEMVVAGYYRENRKLNDNHVEKVYNGLQRLFGKEAQGKNPPRLRFNDLEQDLFDRVEIICRIFAGETDTEHVEIDEEELEDFEPLDKSVIVNCMKRLRKSIKTWTGNVRGNRGYLDYISQFM